jgi:hypothetical protein
LSISTAITAVWRSLDWCRTEEKAFHCGLSTVSAVRQPLGAPQPGLSAGEMSLQGSSSGDLKYFFGLSVKVGESRVMDLEFLLLDLYCEGRYLLKFILLN